MSTNDFEIKYGNTKLKGEDLYYDPKHAEEYKNICPGMTDEERNKQKDRLKAYKEDIEKNEIYKQKNGEDDTYKNEKKKIISTLSDIHKLFIYGKKYRDYTNNNNKNSRKRRKYGKQPNANKCSKPDNIISTTTTTTTSVFNISKIISKMEELKRENDKLKRENEELRSKIEKKKFIETKELINKVINMPQLFNVMEYELKK
tara:strand:+ start:3663 stop:4268 length:606 start_codon:yes stop_codon:yes gene_type:complete